MKIISSNNKKMIQMSQAEWVKIGQSQDWLTPEKMNENMNEFFESTQNEDPNGENFAVDIRGRKWAVPNPARRNIQKALSELGKRFHESVPIDEIFQVLGENGVVPLQEDGTKWAGFITSQGECGSERANNCGPIQIDLAVETYGEYLPSSTVLVMTLCTMPSGKIEFVGYLS